MSRRDRIFLIISLIGIVYIFFGSLSFQSKVQSGTEMSEHDNSLSENSGDVFDDLNSDQGMSAGDSSDSGAAEDGEVPPATDTLSGEDTADNEKNVEGDSFYRKLAAHEDVNILIIGDAIGAGLGSSDEANRWDQLLKTYLERKYKTSVNIQNECFGGTSSYGIYVHLKNLADISTDYDLVIVCCGQNDSDDGFSEIYEALLRNINLAFPSGSVLCILESTQREMTDKMMTVKNLAEHYYAGLVDTITAFAKNYDSLSDKNGFYPNDEGQEMYFRSIINVIDPLVSAGNGTKIGIADAELPDPVNPEVINYDVLRFYPADALDRTDAIRYTMKLPFTDTDGTVMDRAEGVLGIVVNAPVGEHPVTAAIDGEILGETGIINYTDTDENRYHNFGSFSAGKTVRIKFETEEVADRMIGIYISSSE